ncbi:hypothetical protein RFI_23241 [Reticulomyxa filosa]|uniref:Uncharacterized protein n=1 Tax=Reticulomyxa filosa TaxID=46433 RepID=X6MKZ4_RETFI|nr:hypothetical protein RFI_23241 [Reticulomyxa filosa]|eukprot:ETO14127.1 hypothetical protein RFI_23241 [Reticulomyxa filosa]
MEHFKKTGVEKKKEEKEEVLEFESISRMPTLKSNEELKELRTGDRSNFYNGYTVNTQLLLQAQIDDRQYLSIPLKPETTVDDVFKFVSRRRILGKNEVSLYIDNQPQPPEVNLYEVTAGGNKLVSIVIKYASDDDIKG